MTDSKKTLNIAGTGTRSIHNQSEIFGPLVAKLTGIFNNLKKPYDLSVIAGGAKGFDYAFALAAMKAGVRLEVYLPSPTYLNYYWGEGKERKKMDKVLAYADEVRIVSDNHGYGKANLTRNEAMVNASDAVFAYPNPENPKKGGTAHCIRYAEQQGKKVRDMHEEMNNPKEEHMPNNPKKENTPCDGKNGLCRHSQGGKYKYTDDNSTYHLCGVHMKMVENGRDPGLKKPGRVAQAYLDKADSAPEPKNNKKGKKVKEPKNKKVKEDKKVKDKKPVSCTVLWGLNMTQIEDLDARFKRFFDKKGVTHLYVPMGRDRNGKKIEAYVTAIEVARSMGIKVKLIEISGQKPYKNFVKEAKSSDMMVFEKGKPMSFLNFAAIKAKFAVSFEFNPRKIRNVNSVVFVPRTQS